MLVSGSSNPPSPTGAMLWLDLEDVLRPTEAVFDHLGPLQASESLLWAKKHVAFAGLRNPSGPSQSSAVGSEPEYS